MTTRAMVFIDGTWLGVVANRLADQHDVQGRPGGPLDFGQLPRVCAESVSGQMTPGASLDVVRTYWFGSIAANFDPIDSDVVQRRSEFFDALRRQHRYEVVRYETDYRGGRVRRTERSVEDEPREKAVDVALATALLEMAALNAYDIAIVIAGDRDFVPALQAVRRLGKRVALVTARGSCPREFSDANDAARVRDFDPLLLDALWPQIVSPQARPALRMAIESDRPQEVAVVPMADASESQPKAPATTEPAAGQAAGEGAVVKVTADGRAYVRDDQGAWLFFRRADLIEPACFDRLDVPYTRVRYTVDRAPAGTRAGRVVQVEVVAAPAGTGAGTGQRSLRPVIDDPVWDLDPFAPPARVAL